MKFEITPEMRSAIVVILLFIATICAIHIFFHIANDIKTMKDQEIKEKFGGYPAEILKPVTLNMLPDLTDKETKGIVFVKRGCLSASRESLETRYFIREIIKPLSEKTRLQLEAKVPLLAARNQHTLSTLINLKEAC